MKAVLVDHVAGLDVRDDQDVGEARDRRRDMLDPRRLGIHRGVEVERPVDDTADDLAAIRHLREDRSVEGGRHFGAHRFHAASTATFGRSMPMARAKPIAFWQMSRFWSVSGAMFSATSLRTKRRP